MVAPTTPEQITASVIDSFAGRTDSHRPVLRARLAAASTWEGRSRI
jgi:hypothetical protein